VGSTYSFVDATFASSPTLTGGTTYWIKITSTVNGSNYFVWGSDIIDGYLSGTSKSSSNNSSWSALNKDLNFKVWMGGVVTSLSGVTVQGTAWANTLSSCTVNNAIYQTMSGCTVTGTQTVSSTDAAPAAMPISNAQIQAWETIAAAGGVISGDYTVTGTVVLGPRKIDGNLLVDNGAILLLTGPLWVHGDVTISNNATVSVDTSLGNNGAVLIADKPGSEATIGKVTLLNNVTLAGNGNAGSNLMVLTTYSGASDAINLKNNAASVILYAPNGIISVANNAGANQITANQINVGNNATITYVTGLQSSSFSNGPGGAWVFMPGSYSIAK
jgi:hypothetical protein